MWGRNIDMQQSASIHKQAWKNNANVSLMPQPPQPWPVKSRRLANPRLHSSNFVTIPAIASPEKKNTFTKICWKSKNKLLPWHWILTEGQQLHYWAIPTPKIMHFQSLRSMLISSTIPNWRMRARFTCRSPFVLKFPSGKWLKSCFFNQPLGFQPVFGNNISFATKSENLKNTQFVAVGDPERILWLKNRSNSAADSAGCPQPQTKKFIAIDCIILTEPNSSIQAWK